MIDHVSVAVGDIERAATLYERALAPLGLSRLVTRPATVGFGKAYPELWINLRAGMPRLAPGSGAHICLRARSVAEIDAFYAAAIEAGAVSESPPSLRPHDRVRYYAAFIVDHDGNRIEAVTFPQQDLVATG
jgi:catechol 2,3-dioxygenase-like lactoylglutathione lyase family enzyme